MYKLKGKQFVGTNYCLATLKLEKVQAIKTTPIFILRYEKVAKVGSLGKVEVEKIFSILRLINGLV